MKTNSQIVTLPTDVPSGDETTPSGGRTTTTTTHGSSSDAPVPIHPSMPPANVGMRWEDWVLIVILIILAIGILMMGIKIFHRRLRRRNMTATSQIPLTSSVYQNLSYQESEF